MVALKAVLGGTMNRIVGGCIALMAVFLGLFAVSVEPESASLEAYGHQDQITVGAEHAGLSQNTVHE